MHTLLPPLADASPVLMKVLHSAASNVESVGPVVEDVVDEHIVEDVRIPVAVLALFLDKYPACDRAAYICNT